jgi:hypothetical protein
VLALVLVSVPHIKAEAEQPHGMPVRSLPMSIAETGQQCCRICTKGKPCGDGCISTARQCRRDRGVRLQRFNGS